MHPDVQVWIQIVVAVVGVLANVALLAWFWGGIKEKVMGNSSRILAVEERVFPKDPANRFITQDMCDRCQTECNNRNSEHFKELTSIQMKNHDSLCDIRESMGWIKGKLEKIAK